jgi:hypothetical protein
LDLEEAYLDLDFGGNDVSVDVGERAVGLDHTEEVGSVDGVCTNAGRGQVVDTSN